MRLITSLTFTVLFILSARSQSVKLTNDVDTASYSLGTVLGASIANAGFSTLNYDLLMKGISDAINGNELAISNEQANMFLNEYVATLNEKKSMRNLEIGQKFLAENGKKQGVITLPSGLQYKVITEGEGKSPVDTSFVTVHYTGTFMDGKVFDSSVERGQPAQFPVNGVIPGWTEALKLMKPGSKWIIYLPASLAYGETGNRSIEPNTVLVFEVELISVD
jgi:FKBP-type peptidyl-prolyl cis-trans isomerase FklB